MSISDRLDQIEQRYGDVSIADASRLTLIGRDVPDLVAAVRAVLDLHKRVANEGVCQTPGCLCRLPEWTCSCQLERHDEYAPWPCPTVRAIATALGCGDGIDTTPERVDETANREHIEDGA